MLLGAWVPMIDRPGRAALADHLRRLASGRLTNAEFDSVRLDHSDDEALVAIGDAGWSLYDDFFVYRLRGRRALKPHSFEVRPGGICEEVLGAG